MEEPSQPSFEKHRNGFWQTVAVIEAVLLIAMWMWTVNPVKWFAPTSAPSVVSESVELTFYWNGDANSATLTLDELRQSLSMDQLTMKIPFYDNQMKTFEGFWLEDVAALLFKLADVDPSQTDLSNLSFHYVAADGYEAHMPATLLSDRETEGFVAYREVGLPGGANWQPLEEGKEWVNPAPIWLMWTFTDPSVPDEKLVWLEDNRPWPYNMIGMKLVDSQSLFPEAFPVGAQPGSTVKEGHELFVNHCIRCHSMNLAGGAIGPELNVPMNVTEYRDREFLVNWIKNPAAFRAPNRMPSFQRSLDDQQIRSIVDYFEWMKSHKKTS